MKLLSYIFVLSIYNISIIRIVLQIKKIRKIILSTVHKLSYQRFIKKFWGLPLSDVTFDGPATLSDDIFVVFDKSFSLFFLEENSLLLLFKELFCEGCRYKEVFISKSSSSFSDLISGGFGGGEVFSTSC